MKTYIVGKNIPSSQAEDELFIPLRKLAEDNPNDLIIKSELKILCHVVVVASEKGYQLLVSDGYAVHVNGKKFAT